MHGTIATSTINVNLSRLNLRLTMSFVMRGTLPGVGGDATMWVLLDYLR
jgi:hypothetical protein